MSYEEEKKCPLCAEEMDWTDQQLNPCKCGYEVCVWCWHHIMDMAEKDATEGRCPACRTPYDKDRVVGLETNFQRVASISSSRKQKVTKAKPKQNEGRKDLSNVRVIQRRMAYIIGLPVEYAYEELLERKEYFGQYGKVTKVSLSRTAGGTLQQFTNDTCSVYVTFSKEEEAVRCIQSVHGYDLDGRLLRASFGTAKYCHAWLRNTSCNNPTCLYLHTMGAEEDSFGKDEVAAVHTRNRVQEIVGATKYPPRRCGNMLPPPIVEQSNSTSADDSLRNDGQKIVASGDHLPSSKDKDAVVRSSKETTTFVDIVGRSSNSVEEERILNVSPDDHVETESSGSVLSKNSEISDDQKSKDSAESSHTASFSSVESKDPAELSHTASFISAESKDPADTSKDYSYNSWWHTDYHNQSSYVDKEDNVQAPYVNSELNDGYNEKKFQSLAKSDRIYRGSNSFSNEEIVEHLRRLDNDTPVDDDDDESSAAIENTIISNILSMDLDGDSSVYPQTVTGLMETRDGRQGSSWNVQNNEHSRFSFAKEHAFSSQKIDLVSPSSNIGQGLNFSAVQDSFENKDDRYKSQHQASRAQNLTPPGFSMLSKPPPGFSSCMRTDQAVAAGSGSYYKVAPNTHYRSPSLGNLSNSSDDYIDPAATMVGGKSSTSGLTNSWPSSYSSRCSTSSHDDTKNWFFMQQQSVPATILPHLPQESLFSQTTVQQQHHTPQFPSSGLVDLHHQSYNTSLFAQQPKFTNGYQQHNQLQEAPRQNARSEVGKFTYESFLPGYGDYMFQMPTSGDVYTPRVFGM